MSETTEPATIKDLVERFRKFSFRLETYPIKRGGNFVYQFDAAEIAPQHRLLQALQVNWRFGSQFTETTVLVESKNGHHSNNDTWLHANKWAFLWKNT